MSVLLTLVISVGHADKIICPSEESQLMHAKGEDGAPIYLEVMLKHITPENRELHNFDLAKIIHNWYVVEKKSHALTL